MDVAENTEIVRVLGTLLAVIVGGLLTSITTFIIERQKWKRERKNKLDELKREACGAALEWIGPMRNAEFIASSLVMNALQGEFEHEGFLSDYPYLAGELEKSDLSGVQRASLPHDFYSRGHRIVRDLDKLRYLGVKYGQSVKIGRKNPDGYKECTNLMNKISSEIDQLEDEIKASFHGTFE